MTNTELNSIIQETLTILDADVLPEVHNYLFDIIDEDSDLEASPFEIANTLIHSCDTAEPLPSIVRALIIELFEDAFEEGNADAMNDLGAVYYDGSRGFEQSFEKAVEYYKLAAEKGSRQAQENLGYCYYYGRAGEPDYGKAFHYYVKGALLGWYISLYKIGDMYKNGYYVQQDYAEAFRIYRECIEKMDDYDKDEFAGPVYLRLGEMYLKGLGCQKDAKAALENYHKAQYYLYGMVEIGDYFYQKSLQGAIEGEQQAWKELSEQLPDLSWSKSNEM